MKTNEEYQAMLPSHWEMHQSDPQGFWFGDSGRDYGRPEFKRKDSLARIYFNKDETDDSGYLFGISFGDESACKGNLPDAIKNADDYVDKYLK